MRRLMFFASPRVATVVGRRRLRFRFADFLVRMWLLNALRRRTFPDPVTEKRFFAPLWVFIFGMLRSLGSASFSAAFDFGRSLALGRGRPRSLRREDHGH